jgi:glycosyltransferase involved in cell wall biosynthesis
MMQDNSREGNKPSLNVLFIEQFGTGGLTHYVYNLCQALAERGLGVTLLTSTDYELLDLPHAFSVLNILPLWNPWERRARNGGMLHRWARLVSKGLRYLRGLMLSLHTIWRLRPQIVHLSEMKFLSDLVLALFPTRARRVQTCHNVQRFVERRGQPNIVRARGAWYHAQRLMYRHDHGIIFHAEENLDEFRRVFDLEPTSWAVIPQGEGSLFVPARPVTKAEARRKLELDPQAPLVLFFGTIRLYKGVPTLLEALVRLHRLLPAAQLVIAGAPFHDVDMAELRAMADHLGLSEAVIWRVQYVPRDLAPLYFIACDMAALPYVKSYDSAVLKIAQALGVPAVVTDTGGLAAAVEGGQAGVVVPPEDPEALADAMAHLLSEPEWAATLAARGLELARTVYSWASVAQETERFYEKVMELPCAS